MFPFYTSTGSTFIPAKLALAGLVPCADLGIKQSFLFCSPIELKYLLMVTSPAYYPVAPLKGWKDISSNFVIDFSHSLN